MLNRSKTINLKLGITQPRGLLIFRRENNNNNTNNNNNNVSTHVGLLHMLYTS